MQGRQRSTVRRVAAVTVTLALALAGVVIGPVAPAGAACPTMTAGDHWLTAFTIGATGSNWGEGEILSVSGNQVTGRVISLNGNPQSPTNQSVATLTCKDYEATITGLAGLPPIKVNAVLSDSGNELAGGVWSVPGFPAYSGQFTSARVLDSGTGDGFATTDDNSTGATPSEPVHATVHSPVSGALSIGVGTATGMVVVKGYQLLDQLVHITAPLATVADPLVFDFVLDSTALQGRTPAQVKVFRNGSEVLPCSPTAGTSADPDPCVVGRTVLGGGDVQFTVRTSRASTWTFGASSSLFGLRFLHSVLPAAKLGQPYSATLLAAGGTLPHKFKKLAKLPKGLKLKAKTGVISGTPKVRGTFSLPVVLSDKAKPKRTSTRTFVIRVT
jgi:hypothetical protein